MEEEMEVGVDLAEEEEEKEDQGHLEMMSVDELELLKKLQKKQKAQKAASGKIRENLFNKLTEAYADAITMAKKNLVTISTKTPLEDGNVYTITLGEKEKDDQEDVNTSNLAKEIVGQNLPVIESLMGIAFSMQVNGTYEGKELYWQIRKRKSAKE